MKAKRILVSLVAALANAVLFGAAGPVAAQSSRVHPNPLNAKIPHHGLVGNANDAIVTEDGPLKGIEIWGGDGYFGIPYAAPPIGTLRWMPPQPHGKFSGSLSGEQLREFLRPA